MAQYMMLLHEDPTLFMNVSPEEIQAIITEYTTWRSAIQAKGQYAGSNKLKDDGGRLISAKNGDLRVVDGPYAEAKEVLGGYFIIEASDYDAAVEIAKGCPHLKYGGRIEVREVDLIVSSQ